VIETIHSAVKMISAQMKEVQSIHGLLKVEWTNTPRDLEKCGSMLSKLKVALTGLTFLPATIDAQVSATELQIAREILEIGAFYSLEKRDVASFERYVAQLRSYYQDYKSHGLPDSPNRAHILGLNLLHLLAQNRLAEFHLELQLLNFSEIQTNNFLRFPVEYEEYLMQGSYNKIFKQCQNLPAPNFQFFVDLLFDSIREQVATCMEASYQSMSADAAAKMILMDSAKQKPLFNEYAAKRGWILKGNVYEFPKEVKREDTVPSEELVETAISYARALEIII